MKARPDVTTEIYKRDTIRKKHILLADDEGPLRRSIKLILRQAGYKVTALADGAMALKTILDLRATTESVDLVVTDLNMKGLSGMELIQAMRQNGIEAPVLVITGYGNKETVIQLLRLGCADYVDKPLNPTDILSRIDRALRKHETTAQENNQKSEEIAQQQRLLEETLEAYQQRFRLLSERLDAGDLNYQEMLTPQTDTLTFNVAYRNQPKTDQGGAFIDFQNTSTGCDLFMANVPQADINASYHNLLMKAFFEETCRKGYPGNSFLLLLNKQLRQSDLAGREATALFMRIHFAALTAEVISAAHPAPVRIRPNIPVPSRMNTTGDPLGTMDRISFKNRSFIITPGDRIFLFSEAVLALSGQPAETDAAREWVEQTILEARQDDLEQHVGAVWECIARPCGEHPPGNLLLAGLEIPTPCPTA